MHGISKINGRRPLWQLKQLALRREGKDAILIHRHAGMLEQFFRRFGIVENFDEIIDPARRHIGPLLPLFVGPVRCEAVFGLCVHFGRP